jgi:hypothetical protein
MQRKGEQRTASCECNCQTTHPSKDTGKIVPTFAKKHAQMLESPTTPRSYYMRSNYPIQPELSIISIGKNQDADQQLHQLAPILLALQDIHATPEIINQIYALLEGKILPGKSKDKGRPRLTLWQILVLGIVRNARSCDYDQL